MKVEDISGVSLSTRRSSKKKGHLSVGNGLLGQIVVDDASVLLGKTKEENKRKSQFYAIEKKREGKSELGSFYSSERWRVRGKEKSDAPFRCLGTTLPWRIQRKERGTGEEQPQRRWRRR